MFNAPISENGQQFSLIFATLPTDGDGNEDEDDVYEEDHENVVDEDGLDEDEGHESQQGWKARGCLQRKEGEDRGWLDKGRPQEKQAGQDRRQDGFRPGCQVQGKRH